MFTKSIAPIYKKDNLKKKKKNEFHPHMFFIPFAVDQKMCWNIRGGYAWIRQNVFERQLVSANIELALIGLTII